jgi:hypothetical protein
MEAKGPLTFNGLHRVISQKIDLYITTFVGTSNSASIQLKKCDCIIMRWLFLTCKMENISLCTESAEANKSLCAHTYIFYTAQMSLIEICRTAQFYHSESIFMRLWILQWCSYVNTYMNIHTFSLLLIVACDPTSLGLKRPGPWSWPLPHTPS